MPPRSRVEPTDDWHQIALLARAPGQRADELIRPVVLFGQSPAERAAETGAADRSLYRQVARFDQLRMASFLPLPQVETHRTLPPEVRQAILDAKREHRPLTARELTRICEANFGIQWRLADWGFARDGSWPELLAVHDHWVTEHNYQDRYAHQDRPKDRRSPAAVLHRVCVKVFDPEELHRIFYSTRFGRVLDRA
jgi:hypothetical protein